MFGPVMGSVAALLMVSTAAQAAEKCIYPNELEADQVRYVETQLRVAVLQCKGHRHADLPLLYNSFILENRPYLVRTRDVLNRYLLRVGAAPVSTYISGVADYVSLESTKVSQFCSRAKFAAELSAKSPHPLTLLALMPVKYQRSVKQCETKFE